MALPNTTYYFFRCLEQEYAQAFIERGSMRFGHPSDWCKPDGTSRFDPLEGVYASQRGDDQTLDGLLKALRKDSIAVEEKGITFYKSKEVLSLRAHCLYGLNDNNMPVSKQRSQDHRFHRSGKISKEYFQKLFPKVKEEDIDKLDPKKKPAVLFIRPDAFVDFVRTKLKERGVRDEEILIWPMLYSDYYQEELRIMDAPMELFSKHIDFAEQSEVRIVIDTRRKEVSDLFDKNGVIELGPVDESIASIQEYYFQDMIVEIRENERKLLFSLSKAKRYKFDEIDDASWIKVLQQAMADEMPEAPMSIEALDKWIDNIIQILKKRDPNMSYDKKTNLLCYKGKVCDIGAQAGYKLLEHYINYMFDRDFEAAGDAVAKFHHFFPKYNMGNYFKAYNDWCKANGKKV